MHKYDRHIGDYIRDTAHLSDLEDLAYRRLLDLYYLDEKPIGTDLVSVARKVRMATPDGVTVIESVLREFFTEQPDGWHQKRADEEIAAYRNRVISARINGEKGGRPPGKTEHKPKNNRTGSDSLTGRKPKRKLTNRLPPDHSEANASGAPPPPTDPDPVFGVALQFLLRKGIKEANARSYLGLMRKKHGDALVIEVATAAEQEDVSEPLGWMRKALEARATGRPPSKPAKIERALDSIRRTHDAVRSHQQGDADDADVLPAAHTGR